MKKTLYRGSLLLPLLGLFCPALFAQLLPDPISCPYHDSTAQYQSLALGSDSRFGFKHTPRGRLHVLMVFIGFADLQSPLYSRQSQYGRWNYNEIPDWAKGDNNMIFNRDSSAISTQRNLSRWFRDMSAGQFTLTGEVIQQLIIVDRLKIDTVPLAGGGIRIDTSFIGADKINGKAIAQLQALYPNKNWAEFDRRKNLPSFAFDNSLYSNSGGSPAAGDGELDYVSFVHKTGDAWEAESWITSTVSTLNTNYNGVPATYNIGTGHASLKAQHHPYANNVFFVHEFSHNLFNNPHTFGANDAVGNHLYGQNGWSMTGYFYAPFLMANACERWYLGWLQPQEISQNGVYELGDYLGSHDALRIAIPGQPGQYLWVESHRQLNDFDQRYMDFDTRPATAAGLYMFISSGGWNRDVPLSPSYDNTNCFKILHADGNHDLRWDGSSLLNGEKVFEKGLPNPISGINYCVSARQGNFRSDPGLMDYQNGTQGNMDGLNEQWRIMVEKQNGNPVLNYAATGDSRLPFDVGDEIGLSGIVPALGFPYDVLDQSVAWAPGRFTQVKDQGEYQLNGLRLKVLAFNSSTQRYSIEVIFDDDMLRSNQRWCGRISLPNLKSGNQPDLRVQSNKTLLIDKSGVSNVSTNRKFALENPPSYPDFVKPTQLKLGAGAYLLLESQAIVELDHGSELLLQNGSKLELGASAELYVRNGATLRLENGSSLLAQSGARIVIEEGGQLFYRAGALINLNGPATVLEIAGELYLDSNAVFDLDNKAGSSRGYLHFINASHAKRNISGPGRFALQANLNWPKAILVSGPAGINPDPDLGGFELSNARVELEADAAMRFDGAVKLQSCVFSSSGTARFDGIYINGSSNELQNVVIDYAWNGLNWISVNQANQLRMSNTEIRNCEVGLRTYGAGADVKQCYIHHCGTGWIADGMENSSRLDNSSFIANTDAVVFTGAGMAAGLGSRYTQLIHNTNGIFISYTAFSPGCGQIRNNSQKGIYLNKWASLHMDPNTNKFSGNMKISGNSQAVYGWQSGPLYLNNSNSNLASLNPAYALQCLVAKNSMGLILPAAKNYWDINGQPPAAGINYDILRSNGTAVYIPPANYLSTLPSQWASCYQRGWEADHYTNGLSDYAFFAAAGNTALSTPSFPSGSNLAQASLQVLDSLYADSLGVNLPAIDLCNEILQYNYGSSFKPALPLLLFINGLMQEAYGKALLEGQYVPLKNGISFDPYLQKVVDAQHHLLAAIGNDPELREEKIKLELDRALMYRSAGRRTEALSFLDDLMAWLSSEEAEDVQHWICRIEAEQEILNGSLARHEIFNVLQLCGNSQGNLHATLTPTVTTTGTNNGAGAGFATELKEQQNDTKPLAAGTFTVYPNPFTGSIHIHHTGNEPLSVEVYDACGKMTRSLQVPAGRQEYRVDTRSWPAGFYTFTFKQGNNIDHRKLLRVE